MKLHLEIFFIKVAKQKVFYIKKNRDISAESDNPDIFVGQLVDELSPKLQASSEESIIHSTSWRCSHCDLIALTYLVYSDAFDFKGEKPKSFSLSELTIAKNESHNKPRPIKITQKHVVSHGLRHFAFLLKSDPASYRNVVKKETFENFKKIQNVLAGSIHKKGGAK